MIYCCNRCSTTSFKPDCDICGEEKHTMVPLDPSYYPDFSYESKGLVMDIFGRRGEQRRLDSLLEGVLRKYEELVDPYFINYIHIRSRSDEGLLADEAADNAAHSYALFREVLVRKGFDELKGRPDLLHKLLETTVFSSRYRSFKKEMERHIKDDLSATLRSWIEESGTDFRRNICLFIYFIWDCKKAFPEIVFASRQERDRSFRLVDRNVLGQIEFQCEKIHRDILVTRLEHRLANFDPRKFMSIYSIDSMDGFEFEGFLSLLFRTLGYNVKETKKTGDQGADLFAEKFGKKIVIQAKNYTGSVGNAAVQQVLSAQVFYGCDEAMVITNSYFTRSAKELASASSVRLVDRDGLIEYLDEFNQAQIEGME